MPTDNLTPEESPDKGGRPTKYDQKFNKQAEKLCLLGYTNEQLADFFEVHVDTICEWLKKYKRFSDSVKKGKELADVKVVQCLFKRATGFKFQEVTFEKIGDKQDLEESPNEAIAVDPYKKKIVTKEQPPDVTAQIFWLKNRQKKAWRDKVETGLTDKDGNDVTTSITLNLGK